MEPLYTQTCHCHGYLTQITNTLLKGTVMSNIQQKYLLTFVMMSDINQFGLSG